MWFYCAIVLSSGMVFIGLECGHVVIAIESIVLIYSFSLVEK